MKILIAITAVAALTFSAPAYAVDDIGSVATNGWLFKDSLDIRAFDDPDYPGIACYSTSVDKSMSWDNASDSSIACRKVGDIPAGTEFASRSEVFEQSQSPFFKYLQVDRFYDAKRKVLVYLSYVRKFKGENYAHSVSVVPVGD